MTFTVRDLGRMGYEAAFEVQREVHAEVLEGSRPNTLLLVEHDPVLTLGAAFHAENLLLPVEDYAAHGIDVRPTDRGGDVTYHGPGQLVAYPIFRLEEMGRDLHRYLRGLEEAVIGTAATFGVASGRNPVNTGVWVENRKLCAIGIKVRRWVTMHGLALNCDTDLTPFGQIVPCGIGGDYGVTSLTREVGRRVSIEETKPRLVRALEAVFLPSGATG
ncbi:MAG: lipoyl(octanoyl) transferase LipB [Fimbriimonas sp.]